MAASEALLTWGANPWIAEEESMEIMRSQLQAMTWASQAKDAALLDLQKRLQAALAELEQGSAREAALRKRAEVAEAAEEALASQMGELEAEAYASITENQKIVAAMSQERCLKGGEIEESQIDELEMRLQVVGEEAARWERRCRELEAELAQGRDREAALLKRLEMAEAAEEALASQMAEVEAEAYTRITQHDSLATTKEDSDKQIKRLKYVAEDEVDRLVAELQRRLAEAERALGVAEAKLRQAEESEQRREKADGKQVTVQRKGEAEHAPLSLSLQELAGMVKLRLWSPSSLTLTSAAA